MTHAGASAGWQQMWSANGGLQRGQAFDVGGVSQALAHELARKCHAPRSGMSALVPGCGRAYDALALIQHGFERVVAVDLASTACDEARKFLQETQSPAASKVEVVCADFFAYKPPEQFDFIWDVTFLCALDPSVRGSWAKQYTALLKPAGTLLTCVFPICNKVGGPPYALTVDLVRSLLEPEGFQAEEVQDNLPPAAQHRPGAGPGPGAATALVSWKRP